MKLSTVLSLILILSGCNSIPIQKSTVPLTDTDKTKYKFHVCSTVKKGCKYASL